MFDAAPALEPLSTSLDDPAALALLRPEAPSLSSPTPLFD